MRPLERGLLALSLAVCALALAGPIANPDLFWHLSAARRMVQTHAIPTVDWLSWTLPGTAWVDFEWLPQLIYGMLHHVLGFPGLWVLKALLLALGAWALWATLSLYGIEAPYRAAALSLWSAEAMARSDVRPDLFSTLAFALLFLVLEARRLGRDFPRPRWALVFFCAWVNLHAGFAYGLLLLLIYALCETASGRKGPGLWPILAAASAGTLLSPFGPSQYSVLLRHGRDLSSISRFIYEWQPLSLRYERDWPRLALLALGAIAAWVHASRRGGLPPAPLAALGFFGWFAYRHERLSSYYAVLAIPLCLHLLKEAGVLDRARRAGAWACAAVVTLCAAFVLWRSQVPGGFLFEKNLPVGAADFLERERGALAGAPMYNPYGWGGYLGWRLFPDYRVYDDGRYLFHSYLEKDLRAFASPADFEAYADGLGISLVVLKNMEKEFRASIRGADGTARLPEGPYYAALLPPERWALVYWDDNALVMVRKNAAPADWVKEHEYCFLRPLDRPAIEQAMERGTFSGTRARRELSRLRKEVRSPAARLEAEAILGYAAAKAQQHKERGVALAGEGRSEQAAYEFIKALSLDPDDAGARLDLAGALLNLGRADKALEELALALKLKPDFPEARYNKGVALKQLGRWREASAEYAAALKLRPDYKEALNNLGEALMRLGRPEEAARRYQDLVQLSPDDPIARFNLGAALKKLGRPNEAAEQFSAALRLRPDFPEARRALDGSR